MFLLSDFQVSSVIYFKSLAKMSWYSTSDDEPIAIWMKCAKSLFVRLPQPSAMFVGMDDAARLICVVRVNNSLLGKSFSVIL